MRHACLHWLSMRRAQLASDDGFTLVAAASVLAVLALLGSAVIALADRNVESSVTNRYDLRAQLAAEGALDAAQYRMAKTAGGLVGNVNGGSFLSIKNLDSSVANALCISVSAGGAPKLDLGNQSAGMCPEGSWEKLGNGTRMLIRQEELGVLKPGSIVSRKVIGVGQSGPSSHPVTRRMIMRLELRLDNTGSLSLIRRRGVAVCRGGYDSANPTAGCPNLPPPPGDDTTGSITPYEPTPPTDPDGSASAAPELVLAPHVDGTPEKGESLTVVPGQWKHLTSDSERTYQWFRCSTGTSCTAATTPPATTALTYPIPSGTWGNNWRWLVQETVTNHPGTPSAVAASAWSLATIAGQKHTGGDSSSGAYAVTTRSPRITTTSAFKQGNKATIDLGEWAVQGTTFGLLNLADLANNGLVSRQWMRCEPNGHSTPQAATAASAVASSCTDISGATSADRTLASPDVGYRLRARVTLKTCSFALLVCLSGWASNTVISQPSAVVQPAS